MITLQDKLRALPAERRKKIKQRTAAMISEEMTMRELRKAREVTQAEMAKILGVNQEQISRSENRKEMYISTLRRSIEAMGGTLLIIAEFPDHEPVKVAGV